ncbi:uncharacterized protein LOC9644561 [Selaginella moellendorffii]|uniref:uncharacterized protein LOC9644561 n=1 Tax=Selaginella moellendorffii TaxID=88036 RepID=UPI000D1C7805|nr:uncharacterized protein LOC9644561 [Selaginella moellendorffii]|eukprot:XP_024544901.1 uncharacterized protein LOC9644561 [Selaginella moellendorffii]
MWANILPRSSSSRDEMGAISGAAANAARSKLPPLLDLRLDRKVYRPGDAVTATVEISNPASASDGGDLILVEEFAVEVRGTEKLDPQWIVTPKPPGLKQKRGERIFLESCGPLVSGVFVEGGLTRSYLVRTVLPKLLPPSFRGTAVRYFYHLTATIRWKFVATENGSSSVQAALPLEKRIPITVWTMPNNSGLSAELNESHKNGGIVPSSLVEAELQWKENSAYSEWTGTASTFSGLEDDISSQGSESVSHSPKGSLENNFDRLVLQSPALTPRTQPRSEESNRPALKKQILMASFSDEIPKHSQRTLDTSLSGNWSPWNRFPMDGFPSEQEDDSRTDSSPGHVKGKAYNIRLGNQVLVRISPKNPDAVHYFGDTIAGVISFPEESDSRKCLEVSVVLEIREVLNVLHLHPSRKNSQVISKIQSEYHEVVADVSQTHFLFSIPLDGPASFSTPHVTVQWVLRFEFVATPGNVEWSKYAHPLEIKDRETGEWTLPITVHAPLPRTHGVRKDRPVASLRDFWLQSPKASDWVGTPLGSPILAGPSNGHF